MFFRDDFLMEVDIHRPKNPKYAHLNSTVPKQSDDKFSMPPFNSNDNVTCNKTNQTQSVLLDLIKLDKTKENEKEDDDEDDSVKERACDSLIMCIITTLNQGLRNGGGIGDVLRSPSSSESLYVVRVVYDLLFFFVVIIIILNLIFGVIIDTFADLRSEKQQKEEILKNTCFICGKSLNTLNIYIFAVVYINFVSTGLDRSAFDNKSVSFEEHIRREHNMWHYLYFIVLVRVKNPTEFTGPESYVASMIKVSYLKFI